MALKLFNFLLPSWEVTMASILSDPYQLTFKKMEESKYVQVKCHWFYEKEVWIQTDACGIIFDKSQNQII